MHCRLVRPSGYVRVVIFVVGWVFVVSACSGGDGRVSASGARVLGETTAPAVDSAAASGPQNVLGATPLSANEADEGVNIVIPPTATPDVVPGNVAPAVVGAPIVIGVRAGVIQGPEFIRSGIQTWAVVNLSGAEVTIEAVDPVANADVSPDAATAYRSDAIASSRSINVEVDLIAGNWLWVVLDAAGEPIITQPFTVVG